jgi:superfamily II DNA or RNA helicase
MPCVSEEPLTAARKDIIKRLQKQFGVILAHDTGTGKTLSAIAAAEQYPTVKVLVLTPAGLVSNFIKELGTYCVLDRSRYTVVSYNSVLVKPPQCEKKFLICDEAHRLRSDGKITQAVMKCASKAFRVLLLTATPVVNRPSDMSNLIAMVRRKPPMGEKAFDVFWRSKDVKLLPKYISFLRKNTADFPSVNLHTVDLKMPQNYYREYRQVELQQFKDRPAAQVINSDADVFAFLSGVRRASNAAAVEDNPKIVWIRDKVKDGGKFIIYSEWIKAGADLVVRAFPEAGVITGDMSAQKRDAVVKAYNDNKINILFISGAGAEGVDLKNTTDVILLEPSWNQAREDQVVGRAARFKSHEPGQTVNVWKLVLHKPGVGVFGNLTGRAWSDQIPSADDLVVQIQDTKKKLNLEFESKLR